MNFARSIMRFALASGLALVACKFTSDYGNTVYVEGAPCTEGDVRSCGTSVGECKIGEQVCVAGEWGDCSGAGPDVERCDGLDNDCDGAADEDCECLSGATRPCGIGLGLCEVGEQKCIDGFWRACSGTAPTSEVCNEADDDCDGTIDEGFPVGERCALAAGCVGVRICSLDHKGTACVVDTTAITPEVCDGVDNDCDGYVDYWVGPSRLISACECVERELSFGAKPSDGSRRGDGLFCDAGTKCDTAGGELAMSFCEKCETMPYAMCASEKLVDLEPLVNGGNMRVLRVRYTFESSEPAKTLVNLYYAVDYGQGEQKQSFRRYHRLLDVGDVPGSYSRVLSPDHGCFAALAAGKGQTPIDCKGSSTECPGCRVGDTCGLPVGKDCAALNFALAELQVAADWVSCDGEFRGVVRIQGLSYGPLVCDE